MHDAAEAGNLEILQELLKSGAGVSYNFFNTRRFAYSSKICGGPGNECWSWFIFQVEPDAEGVTPLRLAALYGKDNIIQYFGSGKFIDHAKPEIAFNIEKEDIVESIELMGCWYVDRKKGKGYINI